MRMYLQILLCLVLSARAHAQKYSIEKGYVSFFSSATLEDIKADNKKVTSIFNVATGDIVFSIPINEFQFEKSLMEEHFNEKYMESDKYPKSIFQGKVSGFDVKASGVQKVSAAGKLTIHGVTRDVETSGTLEANEGRLILQSKFMVKLEDYKVKIPQLMWQNIAEQVEVTIDLTYKLQ